uniref:Geraniol 10-hydroxylase n=1 Tax=Gentiana macrophylla TaxID=50765 RepID=M9T1R5_9GENT|nr:geraniol 10-hydroxylase [Gentiana macrophylla]
MDFLKISIGLLLTLILLRISFTYLAKRGKKLPPGPTRLPIIGNLHLLGDQPHKSLEKLAKKHGPIMSLKLGQITTVVISSSEMAKEVLQKQDLEFSSNRSVPNALYAHDHYKYSAVWLPAASQWRSLRKVMNTNIFSVKRLDDNQHLRNKKVQELIDYCKKNSEKGEAVDVGRAAFRTTLNLLSNTIFSKDLTDPLSDSGKEFKELVENIMMVVGEPNLVDYFPILAKIDPQGIRRRSTIHFGKLLQLIKDLIRERITSGISQGGVSDVVDVLLTTSQETPEQIQMKHIEHMCLDLFAAGADTTSSTLEWAMTELLKNPDKMKKTQNEIAQVIGKKNVIHESDVAQLPYLRCVVKETLRMHTPIPFLVPRRVEQEVEVCGYTVPKGSQVLVNAWAIGRDETTWKDAFTFLPERFWESELDIRGQDFELIPFGGGRRICPGLPLAVRMIHVMLGSLLNCFDWDSESGNSPDGLDMEDKFGITLHKARPLLAIPSLRK